MQKWNDLEKNDQRRSVRWWNRAYSESGKKLVDRQTVYSVEEAVGLLFDMQESSPIEMDETVECHMNMNLDAKYPDQQIRTSVKLPHGTGKSVKVAVFSSPEEDEEMEKLGAYKYGSKLAKEIEDNKIDFDVLIAKPQAMPRLAKLGKILGPKRLMPSPKSGTVVTDYAKALEDFQGGVIELRNDKNSLVQCGIGKMSFGRVKIEENFKGLLQELAHKKPLGAKKEFWTRVWIGSTQSPSIQIDPKEFPKITIEDDSDDEED
jgi:large subunit ribosomal protein L1